MAANVEESIELIDGASERTLQLIGVVGNGSIGWRSVDRPNRRPMWVGESDLSAPR